MNIYLLTWIWFLIIGTIAGVVIGAVLYFQPETISRWSKVMNRWISTRRALRGLEIPRNTTDGYIMRHLKLFGGLVVILSVITFYKLWVAAPLSTLWHPTAISEVFGWGTEIFVASVRLFFLIGSVFAAIVGLIMIVNEEGFRKFSSLSNKWISSRLALLPLEKMYYDFDVFVMQKHRLFGGIIFVGSVFSLIALIRVLMKQ